MKAQPCPVCLAEKSHAIPGDYPDRMCDNCFFVCSEFNWERLSLAVQRVAYLESLIANFCAGQRWADESWKEQPHIKPLFDVNAAKRQGVWDGKSN